MDSEFEQLIYSVSKDKIKSWLLNLSSFHTRHTKSKYINEVAEWLRMEFKKMGYDNNEIFFHNYNENIDGKNYELKNVICKKMVLIINAYLFALIMILELKILQILNLDHLEQMIMQVV